MNLNKNVAISESGFIFNASRGDSFTTNPIGIDILGLMKSGKTNEDIIQVLLEKYDASQNTLEKDINDFQKMLREYHLSS